MAGMEIDPRNLQNLVQRQMYEDPSGGIFNMRVMLQFFDMSSKSNMTEDERASLFRSAARYCPKVRIHLVPRPTVRGL